MLKKPITYTNFEGDTVTEEFNFHLTKAQLIELEVSYDGGLEKHLQDVVKSGDAKKILEMFKFILKAAYGVRKDNRFVKNDEVWEDFVNSEAYSELFMELVTDANYAAQFIQGIMPTGMVSEADVEKIKDLPLGESAELTAVEEAVPAWIREDRDPTGEELKTMSQDELVLAFKRKSGQAGG